MDEQTRAYWRGVSLRKQIEEDRKFPHTVQPGLYDPVTMEEIVLTPEGIDKFEEYESKYGLKGKLPDEYMYLLEAKLGRTRPWVATELRRRGLIEDA